MMNRIPMLIPMRPCTRITRCGFDGVRMMHSTRCVATSATTTTPDTTAPTASIASSTAHTPSPTPLYARPHRTLRVYSVPGLVDYRTAWSWQHSLVHILHDFSQSIESVVRTAFASSSTGLTPAELESCMRDAIEHAASRQDRGKDVLLLCEHPPVYTMGRAGQLSYIKFTDQVPYIGDLVHRFSAAAAVVPALATATATTAATAIATAASPSQPSSSACEHPPIFRVDRGGQVTFHGPGQLVGYPILNLRHYKQDLHWFLRQVEQVIIQVCQRYGAEEPNEAGHRALLRRDPAYTGVWLDNRKICAVGLACSRWFTWHGFGLNIDTDLAHFDRIVPCGIDEPGRTVARLVDEAWGGRGAAHPSARLSVSRDAVRHVVCEEFGRVFGVDVEWVDGSPQAFIEQYAAHSLSKAL